MIEAREVDVAAMRSFRPRLCDILIDCVEHGASVGFLAPLSVADADAYWGRIEVAVAAGRCHLFVAAAPDGEIAGTVQLDVDTLPNGRHRATVGKLLVHTEARRRGIGEALMQELERVALDAGRWLLVLDTATEEAVRLYERMGWRPVGAIPRYALNPDSTFTDTSFYWKDLTGAGSER